MVRIIYNTDHYLYTKKQDIFFLQILPSNNTFSFDTNYRSEYATKITKIHTDWLDKNNVKYFYTNPPSIFEGWVGQLYLDFSDYNDPKLKLYCDEFEVDDGSGGSISKEPEKYIICVYDYNDWVRNGGLDNHEQYLKDLDNDCS